MDFRRLRQYVDKSRMFFFLLLNIGKRECSSKKPEILFDFWVIEKNN